MKQWGKEAATSATLTHQKSSPPLCGLPPFAIMRCFLLLILFILPLFPSSGADYNRMILEEIRRIPAKGGYSVQDPAFDGLRAAVQPGTPYLQIQPELSRPSFCSGATYLILLQVLNRLAAAGALELAPDIQQALLVDDPQPDGYGVWGRWNANGPGAARLLHLTGMGESFTDLEKAKPGDFLKIFWNNEVGRDERGHLVVYLGMAHNSEGEPTVRFWSSNQPDGYGVKAVPMSEIKNMIFTRLTRPENIKSIRSLPQVDEYLSTLLKTPSSFEEARRRSGIQ